MGPFHATELVQNGSKWWLTTDRKEETRRLNREPGRLCPRGSYADEKTLEEGIYLAAVKWMVTHTFAINSTKVFLKTYFACRFCQMERWYSHYKSPVVDIIINHIPELA